MPIVRLPFAQPIESRTASTAKDARSVNCYWESRGNGKDSVKRPGTSAVAITPSIAAGTAQGMYKCVSGYMYAVAGNTVTRIASDFTSTGLGSLVGVVQNVYFAESGNDVYLFLHNGTNGYTSLNNAAVVKVDNTSVYNVTILTGGSGYTTPTVTFSAPPSGTTALGTVQFNSAGVVTGVTITNHGTGYVAAPTVTINTGGGGGAGATASCVLNAFPAGGSALAAGAVYLDGYTVVATKAGLIYNSNSEDPTLWGPLNYTAAQADPDPIVGIIKHYNYIVVFGEWGTELFYDEANPVGSPFLRQDSYKNEIGCADGDSVVQIEQAVVFVGKSKTRGKSVYVLDGVTPAKISTRYIEKYLNADTNTKIQSFAFKIEGHTFYVMTIPGKDVTFVYDFDEKAWYQWTTFDG